MLAVATVLIGHCTVRRVHQQLHLRRAQQHRSARDRPASQLTLCVPAPTGPRRRAAQTGILLGASLFCLVALLTFVSCTIIVR